MKLKARVMAGALDTGLMTEALYIISPGEWRDRTLSRPLPRQTFFPFNSQNTSGIEKVRKYWIIFVV
jgi:hypothetical protein